MLGPTLQTERLLLRPPCEADYAPFAEMMGDAELTRFIGGVKPPALAWRGLATMVGCWAMRGYGMFALIEKETGAWVGQLGPWKPAEWPGNEIGWTLARRGIGKGYAVEGATAAMDWAFDHLGWTEVIHCIDPNNEPSIRVAERLGSRRLGPIQCPPPYDQVESIAWGQSAEDWRARRRA
ncbi:GNAT family N-acetyltransferase [Caulobacter sp. 17J80-11]|uniref:GNAT family N-acetyltransferase n=1 Tax=Caulobacter sp. 17J80-11 TaxID=2763502 RepID=UPI0016538CB8|nr:GNAT family N-acetyltransferase [Caulobacter sp. 17J80-11]MBC6981565.1 GNAT family N-acetyltransferase [Caulobacter sp. 17J80-11]